MEDTCRHRRVVTRCVRHEPHADDTHLAHIRRRVRTHDTDCKLVCSCVCVCVSRSVWKSTGNTEDGRETLQNGGGRREIKTEGRFIHLRSVWLCV